MLRSVCAILPVVLLLGACRSVHAVDAPHVQLIAESYGPPEIRAALIRAMERRKFSAEKEEEGRITAHFQKSDRSLRVVIEYSPTQFGVRYVDSTGFGETKDPAGAAMIDVRYDDMVNALEKVIVEELKRPAKEAAAAERHRQEYEAMLQLSRTAQAAAEAQAANANANAAQADATQAQANADAAQANADAAQASANGPPTTIINKTVIQNNRKDVVINNNGPVQPLSFCDKPVKAVWSCPTQPALNACMANRGNCSRLCKVGGGC
jgi:hypothetical protein